VNDVIDLKNDSRNPDKQHSPLVSKKISSKVAIIIAIILLSISSYGSMRLSIDSLPIVGLLIIYNIAYSFLLKQLPWLELFIGGFTHIVRLFLGYIVASGTINLEALFPYIILIYSIGFYVLVEKRLYELPKGKEIRNVLQYYSTKSLTGVRYAVIIATILLLLTIESPLWTIFFAVGIVVLRFISSQKDFYRSFLKVMFG
jgi:4-hydroxybenzoate polyprenyltransferase